HLLEHLRREEIQVIEAAFSADEIKEAEEIVLTNAMYGLRWVKQWGNSTYSSQQSSAIFHRFISPLFL
ncbi:MAG TPA: hypothetical protein VL946_10750, partial [Lacibacter sp.]|nr:hypothetical protein [Lacibacter sp.]